MKWTEPENNGGCPILGYAVFRDDGSSRVANVEVNTDNDSSVRDIPTLRTVDVTLDVSDLGTEFMF